LFFLFKIRLGFSLLLYPAIANTLYRPRGFGKMRSFL
jgi:hypothetical protein